MKFYVTKYALSDGIVAGEGHIHERCQGFAEIRGAGYHYLLEIGKDCFTDRADAVAEAEKMRAKKIASLEKQVTKLKAMKFE